MTRNPDSEDRRSSQRIHCRMRVRVTTADGLEIEGATRDLSLHGIFLETKEPLPVGTECRVRLTLGDELGGIPVELEGRIVRQAAGGLGVEFGDVAKDAFAFLRRMIPLRQAI